LGRKGNLELAENVFGTFDELRALADELVTAPCERIVDGSGDGEDVAAGHAGEAGGDQRALISPPLR
jgi:hypothetical protein